jgi:hypothetical protein
MRSRLLRIFFLYFETESLRLRYGLQTADNGRARMSQELFRQKEKVVFLFE